MRRLLRFHRFLLVLLAGLFVAAVLVNTIVNPWRVLAAPWSADSLEPYRAIDNKWNRTAKAGLARTGVWDAAIFGSSRVDIGFDPEHPFFLGMRCANLGLNAAGIAENHRIFSWFMDHQNPQLVVFTIDAGDLTTPMPRVHLTDYPLSPLDPAADPLERECRYLAGISTLAASFETLNRAVRQQTPDHSAAGFRRNAPFPDDTRKLIAGLYLATTVKMVESHDRYDALNPEKVALLNDVVARCERSGTRLVLLLTPNHALFQIACRELGQEDPWYGIDRAELARHAGPGVEVWDFLDGHPLNAEPLPAEGHFKNWIDLFHATPDIGNVMLDRLSGKRGDYGVQLTTYSIERRLKEVETSLAAYEAENPEDLAFLRQALSRYRPQE